MFFISWGSKGDVSHVGSTGLMHCDRCGKDSSFSQMIAYRVHHIYWIFRWITNRTPFVECGNCGAQYHSEHDGVDAKQVRAAIPFWDRRGWTVVPAAIASLFAIGTIAAAANTQANKSYVQTPHVGDIYEADIARMAKNPEAPVMLSALRVTAVRSGMVEVELAKTYFADVRGLDRDLDEGKGAEGDYYSDTRLAIPVADLDKLYGDGVVKDVRR